MLRWYLPAAPAILAGACRWLGLEATFIDLNMSSSTSIEEWADQILLQNPKVVALSVFSYKSREYAEQLAVELKQRQPTLTIVAGGSGIKDAINDQIMIKTECIDTCIEGDGELKWPLFLSNFFKLSVTPNFEIMEAPYTPYYGLHEYKLYIESANKNNKKVWIPIGGSKGCVRKCTFCEIHQRWDYVQRSPQKIINEIVEILKVFPDAHIHFTDSLVNGSLPVFKELLELLADCKKQYPNFTWGGQFIIRRRSQCGPTYWKKIADSGAGLLEIGVETGSEPLRFEMQKKFSNQDLDYSIQSLAEHGIKCVLLMFVGYPTETQQDFQATLDMLTQYQSMANTTIAAIQPGYNLAIYPGSPLYETSKADPNMIVTEKVHVWYNKKNPTLTAEERLRRRQHLEEHAVSLGYTLSADSHTSLAEVKKNTIEYSKIFKLIEKP